MNKSVTIQLPQVVYDALERRAVREFMSTDDSLVPLLIQRIIVTDVGTDPGAAVDVDTLAKKMIHDKNNPSIVMPQETDQSRPPTIDEKRPATLKPPMKIGTVKAKVAPRPPATIAALILPDKIYKNELNTQWSILGFLFQRAFTVGHWESFTKVDIAVSLRKKQGTIESAVDRLWKEKGWIMEAPGNHLPKLFTLSFAGRQWALNNQDKLIADELITEIENVPRDAHYSDRVKGNGIVQLFDDKE